MTGVACASRASALAVVVLLALAAAVSACGEHGDHSHGMAKPWDKTIELKGRSRSLLSTMGRKCHTPEISPEEQDTIEAAHREWEESQQHHISNRRRLGAAGIKTVNIPVYITIVHGKDKSGDVSDKAVAAQVKLMNDAYGSGAAQHGIKWVWNVVKVQRVEGPSMCDKANEAVVKKKYHQGPPSALNLYFTDLSDCGMLGFTTWPWQVKADPKMDGVVIHYDTLPGGKYVPYNMGRTTVHEVGHWLGLYHTFQNGCTRGGDMVTDTPFSASPTDGCPAQRDTCSEPGADPIHNFMDYSDDSCMHAFSMMQHQRMEGQYMQYRSKKV